MSDYKSDFFSTKQTDSHARDPMDNPTFKKNINPVSCKPRASNQTDYFSLQVLKFAN